MSDPVVETPATPEVITDQQVQDKFYSDPDAVPAKVETPAVEVVKPEDKKPAPETKEQTDPVKKEEIEKPADKKEEIKLELKLPKDSKLDPAAVEDITSFAKENGLSNEQAQKILDRESAAVSALEAKQATQYEELRQTWVAETRADKEVGGEKLAQAVLRSKSVLDRFGTPEFRSMLEETGHGDNVEVLRIFNRIGAAMEPDKFVSAKTHVPNEQSIEERLYGSKN